MYLPKNVYKGCWETDWYEYVVFPIVLISLHSTVSFHPDLLEFHVSSEMAAEFRIKVWRHDKEKWILNG